VSLNEGAPYDKELYSLQRNLNSLFNIEARAQKKIAQALHKCQTPCSMVMTLRQLKSVTPSLKPPFDKLLKSRVIFKITCPRCDACYVGQTSRHLKARFSEHKNSSGPLKKKTLCAV
jgi:hypothetical protein